MTGHNLFHTIVFHYPLHEGYSIDIDRWAIGLDRNDIIHMAHVSQGVPVDRNVGGVTTEIIGALDANSADSSGLIDYLIRIRRDVNFFEELETLFNIHKKHRLTIKVPCVFLRQTV